MKVAKLQEANNFLQQEMSKRKNKKEFKKITEEDVLQSEIEIEEAKKEKGNNIDVYC